MMLGMMIDCGGGSRSRHHRLVGIATATNGFVRGVGVIDFIEFRGTARTGE